MEIMERKIAKLLGMIRYFTGKPCRNGHIASRFTQSGTCSECINVPKRLQAKIRKERRLLDSLYCMHFAKITIRAFPEDWKLIFDTAVALTTYRNYNLTADSIRIMNSTGAANEDGTKLYKIRVHPDDMDTLHIMADVCLNERYARKIDTREKVIKKVTANKKVAKEKPWRP